MKRFVTIELSDFAFRSLSGAEGEGAEHVPARVTRAIRCYLKDADSDRQGWRYPDRLRDRDGDAEVQLEVSVDEELWRALVEEAERQDVSRAQLIEHATLYYAAEADAGRLTERILDDLAKEE